MNKIKKVDEKEFPKIKILGVCAYLADRWSMDVSTVRIIFIILIFVQGIGVIAYYILYFIYHKDIYERRNIYYGLSEKEIELEKAKGMLKQYQDNLRFFQKMNILEQSDIAETQIVKCMIGIDKYSDKIEKLENE